jgi:hypothetical protein
MSKYNRYQAVVSDDNENYWYEQIQKTLKEGVQSKPIDNFLLDQINSIVSKKSKFPSVEAVVKDMQARSGLLSYLKNKTSKEINNTTTKTASDNNKVIDKIVPVEKIIPNIIKKCPTIKITIENIVDSTRGNLSIPAILDRVRSIHQTDVDAKDWDDDSLIYFISRVNLNKKQNFPEGNYNNLGKFDSSDADVDLSNSDFFNCLNPAKI